MKKPSTYPGSRLWPPSVSARPVIAEPLEGAPQQQEVMSELGTTLAVLLSGAVIGNLLALLYTGF